jgi:hypothetical protein
MALMASLLEYRSWHVCLCVITSKTQMDGSRCLTELSELQSGRGWLPLEHLASDHGVFDRVMIRRAALARFHINATGIHTG